MNMSAINLMKHSVLIGLITGGAVLLQACDGGTERTAQSRSGDASTTNIERDTSMGNGEGRGEDSNEAVPGNQPDTTGMGNDDSYGRRDYGGARGDNSSPYDVPGANPSDIHD